ncbi:hypothetical protein [Pseudofrankia sp. BMG5.37]|uniref:hypothetical protein n=1 Tax=Pseudofrankia sp. BMG5.37 TaxID=3050035 RepID=UPI002893F98A|nr:hypothetical protein [Pseudofrankia sp. BMG5.37]MDT3443922.1 hypothetical protein [Pseudofrankia sp. BMG5.37]
MSLRVIQFSTGNVGRRSLRSIINRPGLELVGVHASSPDETWTATETITCTMMTVEPGQVAAVRFAVEGIVRGRPAIVMEHVNRLTPQAAPEWPFPPDGRPGVHRVVIKGVPGVEINTHVGDERTDHNEAGVIATAAKAVNAIPAVCAAPPGPTHLSDLPVAQAHGLMS